MFGKGSKQEELLNRLLAEISDLKEQIASLTKKLDSFMCNQADDIAKTESLGEEIEAKIEEQKEVSAELQQTDEDRDLLVLETIPPVNNDQLNNENRNDEQLDSDDDGLFEEIGLTIEDLMIDPNDPNMIQDPALDQEYEMIADGNYENGISEEQPIDESTESIERADESYFSESWDSTNPEYSHLKLKNTTKELKAKIKVTKQSFSGKRDLLSTIAKELIKAKFEI